MVLSQKMCGTAQTKKIRRPGSIKKTLQKLICDENDRIKKKRKKNERVAERSARATRKQVNKNDLEKIEDMIFKTNDIELLIKKNSENAINIVSDFIINTSK